MSDSGGLSTGQRIERLEQHVEAIDRNCTDDNEKIWRELDRMKREKTNKDEAVQSQISSVVTDQRVSNAKLAAYVGIASAVATVVLEIVVKRIGG